MNTKSYYIKLFRENGFNCFPIPRYADSYEKQKAADSHYKSEGQTPLNQEIKDGDNYGVIPINGAGTCILDLDHKELYRKFAEENITNGYMVIETPNGWHIPITGLTGEIKKMMLYDRSIEPDKQIIEIQGHKQYVIGVGSDVFDFKKNRRVFYENKGTDKIWHARGGNFDNFIDVICKICKVNGIESDKSANYNMRKRFQEGKVPTKGTSNYYWYNAAIQCLTDGLSIDEAIQKIREIYDKWVTSDTFSGRDWKNVETKINDAYENGSPLHEGRPKKDKEGDLVKLCQNIIIDRKIYSDQKTDEIFENKNGYLENITEQLHKELQAIYPEMTRDVLNEIKFRLVGLAPDLPPTNKYLKVFDNGVFDTRINALVITNELADMGFKGYNYLLPLKENEPTKYIKVLFENVSEHEHPRLKATLKSAINPKLDSRITIIHGQAGVGKSLAMTILHNILRKYEEYALTLELSQLLTDHFIKAKIKGKTLLILSELPETYKDFAAIKALTGEEVKTERGFHEDMSTFENKLKIIGTTNYLAKIPEKEKNAMYSRRISLIHNTREVPYPPNPDLADEIVEKEGEKIISWILNIPNTDCAYEDADTVRKEWEKLSSPELEYMENNWQFGNAAEPTPIMRLKNDFENKYKITIPVKQFIESLEDQGYYIYKNQVHDLIPIIKKDIQKEQELF